MQALNYDMKLHDYSFYNNPFDNGFHHLFLNFEEETKGEMLSMHITVSEGVLSMNWLDDGYGIKLSSLEKVKESPFYYTLEGETATQYHVVSFYVKKGNTLIINHEVMNKNKPHLIVEDTAFVIRGLSKLDLTIIKEALKLYKLPIKL